MTKVKDDFGQIDPDRKNEKSVVERRCYSMKSGVWGKALEGFAGKSSVDV